MKSKELAYPTEKEQGNSNVPVAIEDLFVMRFPKGATGSVNKKKSSCFKLVLTNSIKPV